MKISIFAFLAFASADDSKKGPLVTDKVTNQKWPFQSISDFIFIELRNIKSKRSK